MITGLDWVVLQIRDFWMLGIAVPLIVKATLILAITQLVVIALPRVSAATKHLLYTVALTSLLLLPVLSLALPQWQIQAFPERSAEELRRSASLAPGLLIAPEPLRSLAQARREGRSVTDAAISMLVTEFAGVELTGSASRVPRSSISGPDGASGAIDRARTPWFTTEKVGSFLIAFWLVGSGLLLLQLLIGTIKLVLVVSSSQSLGDSDSRFVLSQAAERAGVERLPEMLVSSAVTVPMVWGIVRPVILLPREAAWWPADRLRVVLIHELAHVRRMDGLWLLASRFAAATYWFHPLVWIVEKASRRECERASDDLVINRGTRPSDYAGHLLSIAHFLPATESFETVTLGMSRPSQLQNRLRSILRDGTARAELTPRSLMIAVIAAIILVVPLASLQLSAAPPDQDAKEKVTADRKSVETRSLSSEVIDVIGEVPDRLEDAVAEVAEGGFNFDFDFKDLSISGSGNRHESGDHDGHGKINVQIHSRKHAGHAWYSKGSELHSDEHYPEAIKSFLQAYESGYRPAYSAYNAACGYALSGDAEQAFAWLGVAIDKGLDRADLLTEDSDLDSLRSDGRFAALVSKAANGRKQRSIARAEAARADLAELEKAGSRDGRRWYKVGSKLLALREMESSIRALKRAEELLGYRNQDALYNLACAFAISNDRQNALTYLERSIDAGFDSPGKLDEDSDLDNIRNEPRFTALRKKAESLSMSSSSSSSKSKLHRGSSDEEAWMSRANRYETFLRTEPSNGRAWFNQGFALHAAGSHGKAIDSYMQAIRLGYREPVATYNIACAYARLDQKDAALDWLDRAVKVGFEVGHYLRQDDDLDNLRSDPRFRKMVETMARDKHGSWPIKFFFSGDNEAEKEEQSTFF